jgi:hypothetical protein
MGSAVGSLAGAALGSVVPGVGTALGASLGGAAGGLLGGRSASQAASGAYGAAAQQQALAAQAAQFRPVGITTNFGSSRFEVDPATGNLVSAGYTLAPQLQGLQTSLLGGFGGALQQAQGVDTSALQRGSQSLYNLGQGYLSESPEAARQRYISQQQALLAPQQEQALAGIRNRLFQTGRTGLGVGGTTTGMQATNPELAAYYNAVAQQQAQLAAGADQAAQQQQVFGAGLFGQGAGLLGQQSALTSGAYGPLQTQLGLAGSVEQLGQQPLELGSALGGRQAQAGAAAGNLLMTGGINAGRTMAGITDPTAALLGSAGRQITSGLPTASNWFNSLLGGGTNYGTTGNLAASSSAYNPNTSYSGSYDPAAGSTSWYD